MSLMKSLTPMLVALALCGIASPAASQRVAPPLVSGPPVMLFAADGSSSVADAVRFERQMAAADDARWNAAFLGAVAGAVVGGLVGAWAEKSSDRIGGGPPAYYVSVPLGAVVGFIVGLQVRGR